MKHSRMLLVLPLLAAMPVLAQQASVVRETELKSEPFADAKSISMLKARQKIEVGERKGGWYQATNKDGKKGWVRLTSVLLSSTQGRGDSGIAATRQLLQTGRSGTSGVTAATGIRGLDSADVVNAKPNTAAVEKLDTMNVDKEETRRFASTEHLSAQGIDYLPAEEK